MIKFEEWICSKLTIYQTVYRQGIKWIKNKFGDALVVVRLTQRNYLDRIERAVNNGDIVLLENIGETVDAVLDPLLGRVLIRKGKVLKVK